MPETLGLSSWGQITLPLPAGLRRRFGIVPGAGAGDVLIGAERDGEMVVKPTAALAVEVDDVEQLTVWDRDDRRDGAERVSSGR